jgi:hypothetical protein
MAKRHLLMGLIVLLVFSRESAASDPAVKCCSGKLRAAASREQQLFRCHANAAVRGVAVDPACVSAAGDGLERKFQRIEDGDACGGTGDAPIVRADLERIVGGIAEALRPVSTASGCAARKLKAAARLASGTLKASAKLAPHPADRLAELQPVVLELSQRMDETFAHLEAGGGCLTTGDAGRVGTAVIAGASAPFPPDGALLTTLRACGRCGDNVRGGGEDCDGIDSFSCSGTCTAACSCRCGDGVKNQSSESCDGADADACPGLCQADCSCPSPVCGNGIKEAGEQCDGAALGSCAACQTDCTCIPSVCGNGLVEPGEECDGTVFGNSSSPECTNVAGAVAGCLDSCQCCALGICSAFGFEAACCPGYRCPPRIGPNSISFCVPAQACQTADDCAPGDFCFFDGFCRTPTCTTNDECPAGGFCVGICCIDFPGIGLICE